MNIESKRLRREPDEVIAQHNLSAYKKLTEKCWQFLAFISGSRIVKKQRATQGVDARLLSIHI